MTLYIYIHTRIFKSNVRRTLTLSLSPTYPITREPVPFYKQASASFHTITNNSRVSGLRSIFSVEKSRGVWPARLSDPNPCHFLLAANFEGENIQGVS